jgi:hypothetical protein
MSIADEVLQARQAGPLAMGVLVERVGDKMTVKVGWSSSGRPISGSVKGLQATPPPQCICGQ